MRDMRTRTVASPTRSRPRLTTRLGAAALAGLLTWTTAARGIEEPGRPPNILFILADDLGWGDLHCYGHRQIETPRLDRLARQGTLFTQFYVDSPVCSPSRTAFMTGHFPARHAIHGHLAAAAQNRARGMPDWLDAGVTTLPKLLKRAGYATAHFGKWHLGSGPGAPSPEAYGIDVARVVNANGPSLGEEQRDPTFRARSTELIVDEAIRFIEANRDRPFYVNAWTLLTHAALNPTEEQTQPYRKFAPERNIPDRGTKMVYYASATALDAAIGRLLDALDAMGLADRTIVLFSSDNGPEDIEIRNAVHSGIGSAGPFRGRKRSLYEGGIRVPFLVRWPGHVPEGRVDDTSVITAVDFLPTLSRLARAPLPADFEGDGEDVGDLLRGQTRARTRPIFWEWRFHIAGHVLHHSPMLVVRDGPWKLLLNPDGSRVELYNIPADPSELNNRRDEHPEIVERLRQRALAWQKTLPPGPIDPQAGRNDYPWPGTGTQGR